MALQVFFFSKGKKKLGVADAGYGEKEGEALFGKQLGALPWCVKLFPLQAGGPQTEATHRALYV